MTDRLDEIRKRHAEVCDWTNASALDTHMMAEDIAYLLAEVDRLNALVGGLDKTKAQGDYQPLDCRGLEPLPWKIGKVTWI